MKIMCEISVRRKLPVRWPTHETLHIEKQDRDDVLIKFKQETYIINAQELLKAVKLVSDPQ